jgi:hypothetical protein
MAIFRRIKVGGENWTEVCKEVAKLTEGMSGREIAHLALDWQMKTIVTEKGELTRELMLERTKVAMERKKKTVSSMICFHNGFSVLEILLSNLTLCEFPLIKYESGFVAISYCSLVFNFDFPLVLVN